jgi:hypothetical protein
MAGTATTPLLTDPSPVRYGPVCPVMSYRSARTPVIFCYRDYCAWWDPVAGMCCMRLNHENPQEAACPS